MREGLDPRLIESVHELMNLKENDLYSIEALYEHVESDVELTQEQLANHVQVAGQIEPNWMHDLRNLLAKGKAKGRLINPIRKYWGLPREEAEYSVDVEGSFRRMSTRAKRHLRNESVFHHLSSKEEISIASVEKNKILIFTESGKEYSIGEKMVSSRLLHLNNCGGNLVQGQLHSWKAIEATLVNLHPGVSFNEESRIISTHNPKRRKKGTISLHRYLFERAYDS